MTAVERGATTTVVDLVERVASCRPRRLAVHSAEDTITYAELLERADAVADQLVARGVRPGDLVGLCVERSASLVVGALGVLRAGAAYVAIDPQYPDERITWMLGDSGARAVVADQASAARLGHPGALVALGRGGRSSAGVPPRGRTARPAPGDPAYVVYTSGSTGQPKGVVVEHGSLANLIAWHVDAFDLGFADRCTQISSPGFDAVIWELWPTLAVGASLHVVPAELRMDPVGLRDWLVAKSVTVAFLPTALAEGMIGLSWPAGTALRCLLTGGDALSRRPPRGLPFQLVNNYGLSETTVVATSGVVEPDGEGPPTIGRPIAGVQAEVVDPQGQPVAPGVPGELVLGGVAVARGYLNRPELTAERFVGTGPRRRYRTGDLVRERPDGELDFLGRLDDQLSIRGHRVEPAEVAAALNAHPAVAASVVGGVGSTSGERQLVAYLVPSGPDRPDRFELAEHLAAWLPAHLVPDRYVWVAELPLTTHGKVDRAALAALGAAGSAPARVEDPPPLTQTEARIEAVLTELLDIPAVRPEENFFLLGGHSMLGAQLIVRLEALFEVELSLRYLFDHPTLGEIAAEVDRQLAGRAVAEPVR